MRKLIAVIGLALAVGGAGGAVFVAAAAPVNQEGPTLKVLAGQERQGAVAQQFFGDPALSPAADRVRVARGTTVIWTLGSEDFHTVTFPGDAGPPPVFLPQPEDPGRPAMFNPQLFAPTLPAGPWDGTTFVHAELQQRGQDIAVTFAREGTYRYVCLFHVPMVGVVEVVPPDSPGITTQTALDRYVATHFDQVHQAQAEQIRRTRDRAARVEGPGGTSIWFVRAGTDWRGGHLDIMAFMPDSLTVRPGDTVVWYVDHTQPHTVTFQAAGAPPADFLVLQLPDGTTLSPPPPGEPPSPELLAVLMDPASAPRLVLGPGALPSAPSPTHDGRSLYGSGLIGEHPQIAVPMEKVWALTFDTPGTFEYTCVIHEPSGMKGTVTVLES